MKKNRVIRYAVVGLGHIAQVAVLPAFRQSKNSKLVALVSGDKTKLRALSRKYGVTQVYSYEEYDECLNSGEIDAVYIALPNSLHEEYATRAAKAGIDVLCEKPLAVTTAASERILRVFKKKKAKLMLAYRLHFDPVNLGAIELAYSGKIGEPRYITSEFGYQLKEDNIRALPQEGGSPLHDIGIYCINAARYLFKAEPTEVFAFAVSPDAHPAKICQTVSASLRFPGDRLASFTCSFGSASISNYRIVGTRGDLFIDNAYEYVGKRTQQLTVNGKKKTWTTKPTDQFAAELDYFSGCVLNNKEPEPSGPHGLVDIEIIEALLKSIETGRSVSLKGTLPKITRRPTPTMKISKPPHRAPHLIGVEQASK